MTFEEAKKRTDYKFTLNGIEDLIEDIRNHWMKSMIENGDPYRGCAVLEIGYVDVEVNLHTKEQVAIHDDQLGDKTPVISYFTCKKYGSGSNDWTSDRYLDEYEVQVDWKASDWKEQLERDMFAALDRYVEKEQLSYDHPNV